MLSAAGFEVEAIVVAARDERVVQARLANGHQLVAYVPRRVARAGWRPAVGERVQVRVSPCDLSKGRIILESKAKQ